VKRIAMLNCLKSNRVCTGAACLQAFNQRTKTFERYGDEPLELVAFFRCNGCDASEDDPGMEEKVERLLSLKPDAVHMGVCTKNKEDHSRCFVIQKVADRLEAAGATLVDGTH
jgi:predicted metal-binding protein